MFKLPAPPRPSQPIVNNEKLFESFPHGTLAMMGAGCGVIAVMTLFMELITSQLHASVLELGFGFISMPMGVATMILAGLVARTNVKYAVPALMLGSIYWVSYLAWIFV
jgi:hypothetical protein